MLGPEDDKVAEVLELMTAISFLLMAGYILKIGVEDSMARTLREIRKA
jgi:hypothetical protein